MDLDAFHIFLDVARRGSFAATARAHDADPSAISRQIAALEAAAGFRLFERTTRRLALTEAGKLLAHRLHGPVEEIRDILAAARDTLEKPSGLLTVTASVALGERWLMPRLPAFLAAFPEIQLNLLLTDAVVDLVAENVDVGIRFGSVLEGSFVATKLMDTRCLAVASPSYLARHGRPETPSGLAGHNCLYFALPGFGAVWRFRAPDGGTEDVAISGGIRTNSALALRRAALDGIGITLLADWMVGDDLAAGDLVNLFPGYEGTATDFRTADWIVYPSRAYMPAKTRAFIDHLRAAV